MYVIQWIQEMNIIQKENDFLNEMLPVLKEDIVNCNKAVMASPFVSELKKEVPETYFLQREMEEKSFDPIIIPEMQEENKLASKIPSNHCECTN